MTQKTILNLMLGSGKGGLEAVFVQHVTNFHEMGYRSVVVCHPQFPDLDNLRAAGIEVFTMRNKFWDIRTWSTLIRILKTVRPSVMCLHGNRAISFATVKFLRWFVRPFPKLMATTHNARNKRFPRLDGCFAITHTLEKSLINDFGIPPSKVFYCPNAVPEPPEVVERNDRTPLTIGFLGRFHPVKGGDILLEACRILKEDGLPFRLEMAGDGALGDDYRAFVKQHRLEDVIHFPGWIHNEQKVDFFRNIDLLCMPSRSEGLPVTLLEGVAYATPAVVSACPGMMEVVTAKPCGLVFPVEDVPALVAALKTMITDRALWKRYSQAARETFETDYTIARQKEFLKTGISNICVD